MKQNAQTPRATEHLINGFQLYIVFILGMRFIYLVYSMTVNSKEWPLESVSK